MLSQCLPVLADTVPALEDRTGSMTIHCEYKKDNSSTNIDGMELSITRVASVNVDPSVPYYYTLLSDYAESNITFENMTASESNDAAKVLADLQDQKGISGTKDVTDGDGNVSFADLDLGMYLVRQTGKSGTAVEYTTIDPFLVMVPSIDDNEEWVYEVSAIPKTMPEKVTTPTPTVTPTITPTTTPTPTPTPTTPTVRRTTITPTTPSTVRRTTSVKTGDDNNLFATTAIVLVSVAVLAGLFFFRKKNKEK